MNEMSEFKDIIEDIVDRKVRQILKDENMFKMHTGIIVKDSYGDNTFDVNVIDTTIKKVINNSGAGLKNGDTVTVLEKYGSNYSNCFIIMKNTEHGITTQETINAITAYVGNYIKTGKIVSVTNSNSYGKKVIAKNPDDENSTITFYVDYASGTNTFSSGKNAYFYPIGNGKYVVLNNTV